MNIPNSSAYPEDSWGFPFPGEEPEWPDLGFTRPEEEEATVGITVELDLNIVCSECGEELEIQDDTSRYGRGRQVISPCETCIEAARTEGYEKGKEEAQE